MNAPITAAHRQLALQIGTTPSCNPIAPDGQEACAQLIANFTAGQTETIAQLRAALELGQENCDAVYEDLRAERDEARNGLEMASKVIQAGDNERRKLCEEIVALTVRAEHAESEWQAQAALVKASVERESEAQRKVAELTAQFTPNGALARENEQLRHTCLAVGNLCGEHERCLKERDGLRTSLDMVADNFGFTVARDGIQEGDRLIYAGSEGITLRPKALCRFTILELAADVVSSMAKLVTNDDGIDPEAHHIELTQEEANLIKQVHESIKELDAARQPAPQEMPHA